MAGECTLYIYFHFLLLIYQSVIIDKSAPHVRITLHSLVLAVAIDKTRSRVFP